MSTEQETDKNSRKEAFEYKIKNLEERMTTTQSTEEAKFKVMKEQVLKL